MNKEKSRIPVAALALLLSGVAWGGSGASGCEDLSGIAEVPEVSFDAQIQPLLNTCTGCHGEGGLANMDLRPGQSYDNLVNVTSVTNPDRLRVEPFNPENSALFLAVSCESPGGPGFQMGNLSPAEQALIRDWIVQGAEPTVVDSIFADRFEGQG